MHIPAGLRDVHPVGDPQGGRPARRRRRPLQGPAAGRAGARRGPLRPRRGGAGPDRRRRLRGQGRAGATDETRLCLSCNQECVGRMGLNRWLGCIENPRTGREAEGVGLAHRHVEAEAGDGRRRRPGRAAGGDRRPAQRPPGHRVREGARGRRPGRLAASVPNRPSSATWSATSSTECRRSASSSSTASASGRPRRGEASPTTSSSPPAPRRRGRGGSASDASNVADVRECSAAPPSRSATSWSSTRLGFHHATSTAELLADRGCAVEIVTPGMVVGQDLGITLDMENWWIRAGEKGIVQTTDLVPMGLAGRRSRCSTTRPARTSSATPTGSCCRPTRTRSSGCTTTCGRRVERRAGRRLRRAQARPQRGRRGRTRRRRRLTPAPPTLRRDSGRRVVTIATQRVGRYRPGP